MCLLTKCYLTRRNLAKATSDPCDTCTRSRELSYGVFHRVQLSFGRILAKTCPHKEYLKFQPKD